MIFTDTEDTAFVWGDIQLPHILPIGDGIQCERKFIYVTDIYDSQIQFKIVGKKFNFNTVLLECSNQIIDKN